MRVRNLVVALLIILTILGLIIPAIGKVRSAANATVCQNNMRQIVIACHNFHNDFSRFPNGRMPKCDLPSQKRLSWIVHIWPHYLCGGVSYPHDETKPWDDPINSPPRARYYKMEGRPEELMGNVRALTCPSNSGFSDASLPCPTHYVGIAGLGANAAELTLTDHRCGMFGYDRRVSRRDITDGLSTTMAVAEVMDGGPWMAGGRATMRGLVSSEQPYLGDGGQFASFHRTTSFFGWTADVNIAFADCSVRRFSPNVSPQVFEALATIAGDERVDELPKEGLQPVNFLQ
jgi:hypothetical protein